MGKEYIWVLDGNSTIGYGGKEHHIRVHSSDPTKNILYIDPIPWHFEVAPKSVEKAIKFAISQGWEPTEKSECMYVSMNKDKFYVLPKGIKFGYLDNGNETNKNV